MVAAFALNRQQAQNTKARSYAIDLGRVEPSRKTVMLSEFFPKKYDSRNNAIRLYLQWYVRFLFVDGTALWQKKRQGVPIPSAARTSSLQKLHLWVILNGCL